MVLLYLNKADIYHILKSRLKTYLSKNKTNIYNLTRSLPGVTYPDLYYILNPKNCRPKMSLTKINRVGEYLGVKVSRPYSVRVINFNDDPTYLPITNSNNYFYGMVLDGIVQFVSDSSIHELSRRSTISRTTIQKMLNYGRNNPEMVRHDVWQTIGPIVCPTIKRVEDIYYEVETSRSDNQTHEKQRI